MLLELGDYAIGAALHRLISAASVVQIMYAAGCGNCFDLGALSLGGAAAAAAAAAAASGAVGGAAGGADRGFRYAGDDGTVRDSPTADGRVVADVPSGSRLMYDSVVRDANGTPTHYHVKSPGGGTGYIPAANTSGVRAPSPVPGRPSVVTDTGAGTATVAAAQTASGRG